MRIRPATTDDVSELARQMAVGAEEPWLAVEPPVDVADRAERFRDLIEGDDPGTVFMLEDDEGRPAGHGALQPSRGRGVTTFGMLVLPTGRGKGGGRLLLDALVGRARELGSHKIELEVWVDNARAISLYAGAGFEVEGLKRNHYRRKDGSLRSALLMARQLSD